MAYSELGIKLTADDKAFLQSLKNIEARISGLSKNKVKLDVTANNTAIPKLQQQLSNIKPPKLKFEDIKPLGGLDKLNAQLEATKLRYEGMFSKPNVNLSSIKNAENQIGSLKQRINDIGSNNSLNSFSQNATRALGTLSTAIVGVVATLATLGAALTAVVGGAFLLASKSALDYAGSLQVAKADLTVLLGSQEASLKVLNDLKKVAKTTPFETGDLLGSAKVLSTVVKDTELLTKRVTQLGEATGGSAEGLSRISSTYSQVVSKGKADTVDLREFINAGFTNVRAEAQKELGLTGQAFEDAVSEGAISVDILNRILDRTTEGLPRLAAASQTLPGLMSTANDAIKELGLSLIGVNSDTLEFTKGGLADLAQNLLKAFNTEKVQTQLQGLGTSIGNIVSKILGFTGDINSEDVLANIIGGIKDFADKIPGFIDQAINKFQEFKKGFDDFANSGIVKTITNLFSGSGGSGDFFGDIAKNLSAIGSTIMDIIDPFGLLQGTLSILQTGFNNLIGIITNTFKAFQDPKVQEALAKIWTALEPIRNVIGKIKDAVLAFFENLTNGSKEGSESLYSVDNIVNVLSTTFNILADTINIVIGVITSLITWFQQAYNTVSWFVTSAIEFFNNLYTNVSTSVTNIYNTIVDWFTKALDFVNETINNIIQFFTDLPVDIISAIGNIADVFSEWINGALSVGTQIRDGILNGLGDIAGDISSKVSGALGGATNAIGSGFNSIGSALGFSEGGIVPQYLATGGVAGGSMFKSKGTDTVPAMLTPGEFVVNKKSVDTLGRQFMDILNTDAGKVKYALNGLLSAPDRLLTSAGSSNNSFITNDNKEVNINVNYNNSSANPHTLLYQLNSLIGSSL